MSVTLGLLLARLGAELDRTATLAAAIEETLEHGPAGQAPDLRSLQNLDLLTQTLADLVRFVRGLAPDMPDVAIDPVTALHSMTLRGVAARLAGGDPSAETPSTEGDYAVF